jgi:hypothetical protein
MAVGILFLCRLNCPKQPRTEIDRAKELLQSSCKISVQVQSDFVQTDRRSFRTSPKKILEDLSVQDLKIAKRTSKDPLITFLRWDCFQILIDSTTGSFIELFAMY